MKRKKPKAYYRDGDRSKSKYGYTETKNEDNDDEEDARVVHQRQSRLQHADNDDAESGVLSDIESRRRPRLRNSRKTIYVEEDE